MLLALRHFWEISVRGLFFFFFFPQYWWHSPTRPFAIPYMWSPPLLISCLASINKKVHFNSFFLQHATSEPALHFHSDLISSVWISPVLCCLYYCSVVPGRVCSVSKRKRNKKKRPYFLLLWLAKNPSPLSALYISKADSFFVRSYTQGAVIVQIHVHVQYWPFKTTFKTLLVIKKETLYLFSKDKKDSRESHIIIHSINYIVDRTWKYI